MLTKWPFINLYDDELKVRPVYIALRGRQAGQWLLFWGLLPFVYKKPLKQSILFWILQSKDTQKGI